MSDDLQGISKFPVLKYSQNFGTIWFQLLTNAKALLPFWLYFILPCLKTQTENYFIITVVNPINVILPKLLENKFSLADFFPHLHQF